MLLAEDLLLLVTDDASGKLSVPGAQADAGLGGANLVELTLLNRVDVTGERDQARPGRIIVRDALRCEHKIVDPRAHQLSRRQLRARAADIAQGNWASAAVGKAIDEMIAAVAAASAAATAAASG
jgi:hypothetical protein